MVAAAAVDQAGVEEAGRKEERQDGGGVKAGNSERKD